MDRTTSPPLPHPLPTQRLHTNSAHIHVWPAIRGLSSLTPHYAHNSSEKSAYAGCEKRKKTTSECVQSVRQAEVHTAHSQHTCLTIRKQVSGPVCWQFAGGQHPSGTFFSRSVRRSPGWMSSEGLMWRDRHFYPRDNQTTSYTALTASAS